MIGWILYVITAILIGIFKLRLEIAEGKCWDFGPCAIRFVISTIAAPISMLWLIKEVPNMKCNCLNADYDIVEDY